MHLVMTTFNRKPPYLHETLRSMFKHGNLLDLGGENRLTLLVTERTADCIPLGLFGTYDIVCFTDAQVKERDHISPRQRTKLATRIALELGADVVLQDDLEFAPDFWPRFNALLPIDTSKLMVSLYYPQPATNVGLVQWMARNYYGHQAMFYGEDTRGPAIDFLREAREEADDNAIQRLLLKRQDLLLYACVPSLVQHVGITSTLKSRMHRAPSFGLSIEECHAWLNKPRKRIEWPKR